MEYETQNREQTETQIKQKSFRVVSLILIKKNEMKEINHKHKTPQQK